MSAKTLLACIFIAALAGMNYRPVSRPAQGLTY